MECIGKNSSAMIFGLPLPKGKVVNIYRETYKCPECAISEEHPDEQTFVKAPVQGPLIPEVMHQNLSAGTGNAPEVS